MSPRPDRPARINTLERSWDRENGERRWRAAQLAQQHEVPVVIRTFTDQEALEIALVENLQREDLNPIEEAQGYALLIDAFNLTLTLKNKKMFRHLIHKKPVV